MKIVSLNLEIIMSEEITKVIIASTNKLQESLDSGEHHNAEKLAAVIMHLTQSQANLATASYASR